MASKNIRGITIEIDGDTTKLGKALEGAEGSSKSLQSELKGINTLLKLDPSNVELLTQKQKVLTDAIGATEDKLKTLKNAQAQVQKQFEKGEISEQQYRDFQREIVATEQKLEGLKKEAKDFGSVFEQQAKVASESIEELGSKVEVAGKALNGVSAIAGAGLVASAKGAADNEKAVNKYIASTGKAVTETEKYKEIMERIYRNNYGESIEDVADKMRIVSNILGDLPEDELQRVVEKSYMLEDAYGMDFQENVRGVNALIDQFGITADQAYELINQGAQKGLNQNQDLTDQIAEYSTYYAKLGFDAEDFFNIMISGAESGAYQIDYLNDAMKEFGIRTKDNSTSTNDAYKALGLNANKINEQFAQGGEKAQKAFATVTQAIMSIEDPVKRNEIGVALFGTKFEDLEESAVFAMASAKDQVSMLGDTVEQTSETMYGGTSAKAQEALRSIQTAFAQLGEALLPIIAPIVQKIAELATKFSELSPVVQNIILVIMGIVAALGPVLTIIGKVMGAVGTITPIVTKLGGLLAKAGPILTAIKGAIMGIVGTLGWPVIAITAIIAVIVLLWNKCEWFRDAVKALWEGIKIGFGFALEFIKSWIGFLVNYFSIAWEGIKAIFGVAVAWYTSLFEAVKATIMLVWDSVVSYFKMVWKNIKIVFSVVKDVLSGYFKTAWIAIKAVWDIVGGYFKQVWNTIKGIFSVVKNVLTGNWKDAWNGIKNIVSGWANYFKSVWNNIKKIFSAVGSFFKNSFQSAWNGIKSVFSNFGSFFSGLWNNIKSTFSNLGTKIGNAMGSAVKSGINGIISSIERTINSAIGLINGAINLINKLPGVSVGKVSRLSLPRLATGDVAEPNKPYLAMLGDNKTQKEVISPVDTMRDTFMDALTSFTNTRMQNANNQNGINELTRLMKQYMPLIVDNLEQEIVLNDRTLVGKLAPKIDKQLGVIATNKGRGY